MMMYVILAFILSLLITAFSVPQVLYLSHRKRLMDAPDDIRKLHIVPTPNLGGISIFFGFILSTLLTIGFFGGQTFPYLLAGAFMLFIVGMKDDLVGVGASKKLLAQILAAIMMVYGSGVHIESFGGLLGIYNLPVIPAQLFTAFAVVIILNAFNLIDGVDGLASTLGLIASATFGFILFSNGYLEQGILAFALSGALAGFLIFNFEPARIFMGDTGSMMVGYLLSFLAFSTMQANTIGATVYIPSVAIFAFAVLGVTMFDTLRIIIIRLKNRRNPLEPDANHVHHHLLRAGFGHRGVTIILGSANLVLIAATWMLRDVNVHIQLVTIGLLALSILPFSKAVVKRFINQNKSVPQTVSSSTENRAAVATQQHDSSTHGESRKKEVEFSM